MARPPMTYDDIAGILKRAMEDPNFRDKLVADPKEALKNEAKGPGPATIEFFRSLDDRVFTSAVARYRVAREGANQADMEA